MRPLIREEKGPKKGSSHGLLIAILILTALVPVAVMVVLGLLGLPVWLLILLAALFTPAGGTSLQLTVSIMCYLGIAAASLFSKTVRSDMARIRWNPFNCDAGRATASEKVSFYKGVPVFRPVINRSGSFALILFSKRDGVNDLKHERGHNWQLMLMGIATYAFAVAIPSPAMLGRWSKRGNYYGAPWEAIADFLGGAERTHNKVEAVNTGFYFAAGLLLVPAAFWWIRRRNTVRK